MSRHLIIAIVVAAALFAADAAAAQNPLRLRRQIEARGAASGWIGVSFLAPGPPVTGVVVEDVVTDATAERAGVLPGDTIVRWNGRTDVLVAMRETTLTPGDTVTIRIRREGERDRDLTIVAEPRPDRLIDAEAAERLRQALAEMSRGLEMQSDRIRLRIDSLGARLGGELRFRMDSLFVDMDSLNRSIAPRLRAFPRDSLMQSLDSLRARRFRIQEFERGFMDAQRALQDAIRSRDGEWLAGERLALESFGPMALRVTRARDALAGAEVTSLNPGLASYFGVDDGVLILRVVPETPAAIAGLREGDVIVEAAGAPVTDVVELRRQMFGSREGVELEIVRQRQRQTIVLGR